MEGDLSYELPDSDDKENFTPKETVEIRVITSSLGRFVETSVLKIWESRGVYSPKIDLTRMAELVHDLRSELDKGIGRIRMTSVDFSRIYQDVVTNNHETVRELLQYLDFILDDCGIPFSYSRILSSILLPGNLFGRFYIESALMIAKEACLEPIIELESNMVLHSNVLIGNHNDPIAEMDGLVVEWDPELDSTAPFESAQRHSLFWLRLEMKAVFITWRNTGENVLQSAPQEFAWYLDNQAEAALNYWLEQGNDYVYPDHGVVLCCLRGWRDSVFFMRSWEEQGWVVCKR